MTTTATRTMLMLGMIAATAAPAAAQGWDRNRDRDPRDGACFYKDADYRGPRVCVAAGEALESVPWHLNDEISSIRTFGRVEVTVYRDPKFRGRSVQFLQNVPDLLFERWNDRVSSIQIHARTWAERRPDWNERRDDRREDRRDDRDDRRDVRDDRRDDRDDRRDERDERRDERRVSGAEAERIVRRAYRELLKREVDDAGLRIYVDHMVRDDWSEEQVRDSIRSSPEYREKTTMTWPKAQEIVRQAYLSVLRREPDAGSRGYVDRVFRDEWTQADVERELRKSPEARGQR